MRLAVRPFAMASEDSVRFSKPWHQLRTDGEDQLLGAAIEDWDYMTVLRLNSELDIGRTEALERAHLGPKSELTIVISAGSSATKVRRPVWLQALSGAKTQRLSVEIELPGDELGGRLDLITQLVVSKPDPADELAPTAIGSTIWREKHSVFLEGSAPQFPTESGDLSQPPYRCAHAAWVLEVIADDIEMPAAAAVRLIINDTHPLMRRILEGDSSPECVTALETIRWDVARQLVELALTDDVFLEHDGTFEEDTLGSLLMNVININFPGQTPRALRSIRETNRARYEVLLQDAIAPFG